VLQFVNLLCCKICKSHGNFHIAREWRQGLFSKIVFQCQCGESYELNSCKITRSGYENNVRFVDGVYEMGAHHRGGERLCAAMNMPPPPSAQAWSSISDKIHHATVCAAAESMDVAVAQYREDLGIQSGVGEAVVSFDGSWQRRGFQSKNGVVTALSVNGNKCKVVDTVTLSNHCDGCKKMRKVLKDETEFEEWKRTDHAVDCAQNYSGSAGSMEPHGVELIYRCSERKYKLQYTGFLGDGDSKSYPRVANADPPIYENKEINKLECCGHVQKKMYNRCKKVVSENAGKKFVHDGKTVKGISGKGRLTDKKIKVLQGHYGAAIRQNPGNVPAMKKAVWAIYNHRNGDHQDCPEWCPMTKSGDLEVANKHRLPGFIMDLLKPVFDELGSEELLSKCAHGGTQNANEALHHLIWQRCPKAVFVGRKRLEIAVASATLVYNDGESQRQVIYDTLGFAPGVYCEYMHSRIDNRRIVGSVASMCALKQQARKDKQISKSKTIDCVDSEYIPGGF